MAVIKLFAAIREAAGLGEDVIEASDVKELLGIAIGRYGSRFEQALPYCNVAVNGILADKDGYAQVRLEPSDEVALLPPVSGG